MRARLSEMLKVSLKAKQRLRTSTLRLILAAIKDRDIAARGDGNQSGVGDDEILGILQKMIKQRRESIGHYQEGGRLELAEQEQQEIEVIEEFLPAQLSDDEIRTTAKAVVTNLQASGLKDMGRVMAALKERHAGQMDFGKASAAVKALLAGGESAGT